VLGNTETPVFREVVHALFAARRKTLRNGLAGVVGRERAGEACAAAGIDPGVRPEVLAIEELGRLAEVCAALREG
jgi:16S rRNA (adenine1518-N6/adenine1519-N6)-dimethyltransferase